MATSRSLLVGDAPPAGPGARPHDKGEYVRTLVVVWDEQDNQSKAWRDVAGESVGHHYKDFPLAGRVTSLDLRRHMNRFCSNPKMWMESF